MIDWLHSIKEPHHLRDAWGRIMKQHPTSQFKLRNVCEQVYDFMDARLFRGDQGAVAGTFRQAQRTYLGGYPPKWGGSKEYNRALDIGVPKGYIKHVLKEVRRKFAEFGVK